MALYRRGRVWWVDYYVSGKRVQESTRTRNRQEAEKHQAVRKSEVVRGVYFKPVKIPLAEFVERYLEYARTHKRSWKRDQQMLGQLLTFFGNVDLGSITCMQVEAYQQKRVREVCPATVNRELAVFKHMFNVAEKWDLIRGRNPVRLVKFLREDNLKFQTLSAVEERALLDTSPPYLRDMIRFALATGLRSGDIFNLKWEDIDLEKRRLDMIAGKTRRRLEIPLSRSAMDVLQRWHSMKYGPFVFVNQKTGDHFKDIKRGFKLACQRAGITGITWHTLRHTFASRLTRNGVDIVTVKELLGHSTIVVTMRYAHSNYETKARAVEMASSNWSTGASSDKTATVAEEVVLSAQ